MSIRSAFIIYGQGIGLYPCFVRRGKNMKQKRAYGGFKLACTEFDFTGLEFAD